MTATEQKQLEREESEKLLAEAKRCREFLEKLKVEKPLIVPQLVEIARSFSYKLNVGNYESRDFFCSQKAECLIEKADEVSEALHQFCKRQVLNAVAQYTTEHASANMRSK